MFKIIRNNQIKDDLYSAPNNLSVRAEYRKIAEEKKTASKNITSIHIVSSSESLSTQLLSENLSAFSPIVSNLKSNNTSRASETPVSETREPEPSLPATPSNIPCVSDTPTTKKWHFSSYFLWGRITGHSQRVVKPVTTLPSESIESINRGSSTYFNGLFNEIPNKKIAKNKIIPISLECS